MLVSDAKYQPFGSSGKEERQERAPAPYSVFLAA